MQSPLTTSHEIVHITYVPTHPGTDLSPMGDSPSHYPQTEILYSEASYPAPADKLRASVRLDPDNTVPDYEDNALLLSLGEDPKPELFLRIRKVYRFCGVRVLWRTVEKIPVDLDLAHQESTS